MPWLLDHPCDPIVIVGDDREIPADCVWIRLTLDGQDPIRLTELFDHQVQSISLEIDIAQQKEEGSIDDAIQATERNLAAVREQDSIRSGSLFDTLSLRAFDPDAIDTLLQRDIAKLDAAAADRVTQHLAARKCAVWMN